MTETEKSHTEGVADKSNSRKAALLIPLYHALKQQATLNGLDHGKSIFWCRTGDEAALILVELLRY